MESFGYIIIALTCTAGCLMWLFVLVGSIATHRIDKLNQMLTMKELKRQTKLNIVDNFLRNKMNDSIYDENNMTMEDTMSYVESKT
jgi:hypothetical protein